MRGGSRSDPYSVDLDPDPRTGLPWAGSDGWSGPSMPRGGAQGEAQGAMASPQPHMQQQRPYSPLCASPCRHHVTAWRLLGFWILDLDLICVMWI